MLSFLRYAFTHLGCHLCQTELENLYTQYLCIGHMQVNTLHHVYSRCILRWQEGVPGLQSPSIHSPPMTCLRSRLSIVSLGGTLLGYDAGLLLTSEEDFEAVFENCWLPVFHSSIGSACCPVSPKVFLRRVIPAHFLLLPRYHRLWKGSWKPLLAL